MSIERIFYTYIYLDPRKLGSYEYCRVELNYEPFYVGKGVGNRFLVCHHFKQGNPHLERKINKIGKENVVIKVFYQNNEEKAFNLEKEFINNIGRYCLNKGPLVNLSSGGDGFSHTEESKEKCRISKLGNKNPNYGKKYTDEEKLELSKKLKGRKFSLSHRQKIGEANKRRFAKNNREMRNLFSERYRGEKSNSAKLTNSDARNIRVLYKERHMTMKDLSKKYKVTLPCICNIINFKSFKKV